MSVQTTHSCNTHKVYGLSCSDYDALRSEADGHCQRCGNPTPRLSIDHDHALGLGAVRGLVCPGCNTRLGKVEAGEWEVDELDLLYLEHAWYVTRTVPFIPDNRTPMRQVRMGNDVWKPALAKARRNGETLTDVLVRALKDYLEEDE